MEISLHPDCLVPSFLSLQGGNSMKTMPLFHRFKPLDSSHSSLSIHPGNQTRLANKLFVDDPNYKPPFTSWLLSLPPWITESHVEVGRNGIKQITGIAVFCQIHLQEFEWVCENHHKKYRECKRTAHGRLERRLTFVFFFPSWKSAEDQVSSPPFTHRKLSSCHYVLYLGSFQASLEYVVANTSYLNLSPYGFHVSRWAKFVPNAVNIWQGSETYNHSGKEWFLSIAMKE